MKRRWPVTRASSGRWSRKIACGCTASRRGAHVMTCAARTRSLLARGSLCWSLTASSSAIPDRAQDQPVSAGDGPAAPPRARLRGGLGVTLHGALVSTITRCLSPISLALSLLVSASTLSSYQPSRRADWIRLWDGLCCRAGRLVLFMLIVSCDVFSDPHLCLDQYSPTRRTAQSAPDHAAPGR